MTLARLLASGFGLGFAPAAPGTVASVAALLPAALLLAGPAWGLSVAALLAAVGGWWAVKSVAAEDDPPWVVIDEIAGQFVALTPLARPSPVGLLAGLLLFRLFDIAKPSPIRWFDQRSDAAGVIADDLAAGVLAALLLGLMRWRFPGLIG